MTTDPSSIEKSDDKNLRTSKLRFQNFLKFLIGLRNKCGSLVNLVTSYFGKITIKNVSGLLTIQNKFRPATFSLNEDNANDIREQLGNLERRSFIVFVSFLITSLFILYVGWHTSDFELASAETLLDLDIIVQHFTLRHEEWFSVALIVLTTLYISFLVYTQEFLNRRKVLMNNVGETERWLEYLRQTPIFPDTFCSNNHSLPAQLLIRFLLFIFYYVISPVAHAFACYRLAQTRSVIGISLGAISIIICGICAISLVKVSRENISILTGHSFNLFSEFLLKVLTVLFYFPAIYFSVISLLILTNPESAQRFNQYLNSRMLLGKNSILFPRIQIDMTEINTRMSFSIEELKSEVSKVKYAGNLITALQSKLIAATDEKEKRILDKRIEMAKLILANFELAKREIPNTRGTGIALRVRNLSFATLKNLSLNSATLINQDFSYSNLVQIDMRDSNLKSVNFDNANIENVLFTGSTIGDTTFRKASLSHSHFNLGRLSVVDFSGASLLQSSFDWTTLDSLDFTGASLMKPSFVATCINQSTWKTSFLSSPDFFDVEIVGNIKGETEDAFSESYLDQPQFLRANFAPKDFHNAVFSCKIATGRPDSTAEIGHMGNRFNFLRDKRSYEGTSFCKRNLRWIQLYAEISMEEYQWNAPPAAFIAVESETNAPNRNTRPRNITKAQLLKFIEARELLISQNRIGRKSLEEFIAELNEDPIHFPDVVDSPPRSFQGENHSCKIESNLPGITKGEDAVKEVLKRIVIDSQ